MAMVVWTVKGCRPAKSEMLCRPRKRPHAKVPAAHGHSVDLHS